MATSGSTDFSVTRDDIITEALEQLGVLAEGESPNANQLTSCARTLNMLIKYWQADGFNIFALANQTIDLTAGTVSYTLSPRPMMIMNAVRVDSDGIETPLDLLNRNDYIELTDKDSTGAPVSIYYDPQVGTNNKMYIWPVPNNADYDIKVWYQRSIHDVDQATDDVDYPQEWYLPLAFNLAVALANKYAIPPKRLADIVQMAVSYKETAEGFDQEDYVQFSPDFN